MVMDSAPYPFGRTVTYVVPGSGSMPRVFKSRDEAMASLSEGHVLEYVETNGNHEYLLAYAHDRDSETRVMDMSMTDEGTVARYFPDVSALRYDRYGSLSSFVRDLEEYKAFWERVQDSDLKAASRSREGSAERSFLVSLRDVGCKLAYNSGGYVCLEEMEEMFIAYDSE